MAKKPKYVVEFKGTTFTRDTTRTYTNVLVRELDDGRLVAVNWCGRPDLAQKLMSQWAGYKVFNVAIPQPA